MTSNSKRHLKLVALVLLVMSGCESNGHATKKRPDDSFLPEDDTRSYRRFAIAQEAAGARHDGMLYEYHFDGDRLNSLGEHKLAAMLKDNEHAFPVMVYLNFPEAEHQKLRQEAVSIFLLDCGLKDTQMQFAQGPNPHAASSGAHNLARLSKTESESPVASNPTNSAAPGAGTGGGGGSGGDSAGK